MKMREQKLHYMNFTTRELKPEGNLSSRIPSSVEFKTAEAKADK
jgi:hypothetical protein